MNFWEKLLEKNHESFNFFLFVDFYIMGKVNLLRHSIQQWTQYIMTSWVIGSLESIKALKACLMLGDLICVIDKTSLWNQLMTQKIIYFTRLGLSLSVMSTDSVVWNVCSSPWNQGTYICLMECIYWEMFHPTKSKITP